MAFDEWRSKARSRLRSLLAGQGLISGGGEMSRWASPRTITGGGESAERKRELGRLESGGDLQAQAAMWTTPQAHDSHGGDASRVRRQGTIHGCANLADDVCGWEAK